MILIVIIIILKVLLDLNKWVTIPNDFLTISGRFLVNVFAKSTKSIS